LTSGFEDKDEYGEFVEWYWQGKTGSKTWHSLPKPEIRRHYIHFLSYSRTRLYDILLLRRIFFGTN
jgi:hypothetical protein